MPPRLVLFVARASKPLSGTGHSKTSGAKARRDSSCTKAAKRRHSELEPEKETCSALQRAQSRYQRASRDVRGQCQASRSLQGGAAARPAHHLQGSRGTARNPQRGVPVQAPSGIAAAFGCAFGFGRTLALATAITRHWFKSSGENLVMTCRSLVRRPKKPARQLASAPVTTDLAEG